MWLAMPAWGPGSVELPEMVPEQAPSSSAPAAAQDSTRRQDLPRWQPMALIIFDARLEV
jgi:hypothetical protein